MQVINKDENQSKWIMPVSFILTTVVSVICLLALIFGVLHGAFLLTLKKLGILKK